MTTNEENYDDNEVSVSAELTETGVKASAKSRTLSGVDRLGGEIMESFRLTRQLRNQQKRLEMEAKKRIASAAVDAAVDRIKVDPVFAERALTSLFDKAVREQTNKDAVIRRALEDLRDNPPTEKQATEGPETLSDEFLDRIEPHAARASTEELRVRWGKVLAAEVREPGTADARLFRIIDEIEPEAAALFNDLASFRLGNVIPRCLCPELDIDQKNQMEVSSLLIDPASLAGHVRHFDVIKLNNNEEVWGCGLGDFFVTFKKDTSFNTDTSSPLDNINGKPAIKVYVLTKPALKVANLSSANQENTVIRLAQLLKFACNGSPITIYKENGDVWSAYKKI